MSDSEMQNNHMSQQEEQPIASDGSSISQQNDMMYQPDHKKEMLVQRQPNDHRCATYVFNKEYHTLGNVLRTVLNGNADVEFAGYSIPHPSETKMNLRVQTQSQDTNDVINEAFLTVQNVAKTIREKFVKAIE